MKFEGCGLAGKPAKRRPCLRENLWTNVWKAKNAITGFPTQATSLKFLNKITNLPYISSLRFMNNADI